MNDQTAENAVLRWTVLTLFPELFGSFVSTSLFGRAVKKGLLSVDLVNFRDYAEGRHRVVDDDPYGGGSGMVIKVEPVARALDELRRKDPEVCVVLLCPQGEVLDQQAARGLSRVQHLALLCGRYEGVDERVRNLVDREVSIGDFVLSGGESAAMVVMEAVSRLVPGVVGAQESVVDDSFGSDALLDYPHYTRPREFQGMEAPAVLLSGDHAAIASWRRKQAILRTAERRPDLLAQAVMTDEERAWLKEQK